MADVSDAKNAARLPWLASMPSTASELVCVGKIKSNGVSQSLFIDRSEWPVKTSHRHAGPQARPHQTRAAAVAAATAVAAAAPKVICISPVENAERSHTVIRRAVSTANHGHQQFQQQQNKDDKQKTGRSAVPVIEVVPTVGCVQTTGDASVHAPRLACKRIFEQTKDYDSRNLRLQLRAAASAKAKAARTAANADAVVASSKTSTVLPGSSVLLPGWASKGNGDGRPQLRPLLPRSVDMPPACTMTSVITIIPDMSTLCNESVAMTSSDSLPSPAVMAASVSPVAARTQTTSVACVSSGTATTYTASAIQCFDRSSAPTQPAEVERRSATDRNEAGSISGSQLLQRIRLIECEMTTSDSAPVTAPPFCINIVPLNTSADDTSSPSQRLETSSMYDASDEQPPAQMLEALRLVRKPSSRPRHDVIVTSSQPADLRSTSDATIVASSCQASTAASSAAAGRLVTMKLVKVNERQH